MKIQRNTPKTEVPTKEKNDWEMDFDFEQYEEESEEKPIETIKDLERPNVTGLRSRFSNGQAELERMAELNKMISKYSIEVSSRTQELPILWKYYGVLDEFWESMRNIYGAYLNTEVQEIQQECEKMLEAEAGQKIKEGVHKKLLYLRSTLYRLKQLGNLGIEVDRTGRSAFSKTKDKIVQ